MPRQASHCLAMPRHAPPSLTAPQIPNRAAPHLTEPSLATPRRATPNLAFPGHKFPASPHRAEPYQAMPYRAEPNQTTPCPAPSQIPCRTTPHRTPPDRASPCHATPCPAIISRRLPQSTPVGSGHKCRFFAGANLQAQPLNQRLPASAKGLFRPQGRCPLPRRK